MAPITDDLKHYLAEVTGMKITVNPLDGSKLPFYLTRQYDIYRLEVGKVGFTAIVLRQATDFSPAQFVKHVRRLPNIDSESICIVAKNLPSYVRKRLIERRISFVVPKVQMYLPALGMELRLRSGKKKDTYVEKYSPATQVVIIYWLIGRIDKPVTPLELSKQLYYSAMSMSRAVDELESTQITHVDRLGKERLVTFPNSRKDLWQQVLPRLRNPVSRIVRIHESGLNRQVALPAGLTALSTWSMISESRHPEYALSRENWKTLEKAGIEEIPIDEPDTCMIEIWRYDPKILEVDGQVDPFSLYLSLQDKEDERIEMALEETMEKYL